MPNFNLPKWLRLPSPKELGKSDSDSLPLEFFGANEGEYTWESWIKEVKEKYPIKYFLCETLPMFFRVKITMNLSYWWYWFRCHTYTKYHMLDLRNYEYKWGFQEPSNKLLYASFACLDEFVNSKYPEHHIKWSKEALESKKYMYGSEENDVKRLKIYEEILELHNWWHVVRLNILQLELDALKSKNFKSSREIREELSRQECEALKRLAEIREYMWN